MPRLHLPIHDPCHEDWTAMARVGESRRFCDSCSKHVHNVSSMTEREARELLAEESQNGRVCVRYITDAAGHIKFKAETTRASAPMGFSASWVAAASLAVGLLGGCADGEPTRIEADQCVYEVGPWSFSAERGEGSCPPLNEPNPIGDATIHADPDPDTQVVGELEAVPPPVQGGVGPIVEEPPPPPPANDGDDHVKMGKIAAPPPVEHVKMGDVTAVQEVPCEGEGKQPGTSVTPDAPPAEVGPRRL